MYNAFFMDLPVSSFVSHSSLLTAKGVDLTVACDGFPSYWKSFVFFIVAILIAEVLLKQFLIHTAYFTFQMITTIIGVRGTISFFRYSWIAEVLFEQFLI